MKRIGVMTSGGDAPGMNAAVRAVVRAGLCAGFEVMGIERGYQGMIDGSFVPMTARSVSNIIQRGGTILFSARSKEFHTKEGRAKAIANLKRHAIDGLVLIGGDGTFTGAQVLMQEWDGAIIGVPGTIDNDLYGTDFTIGFDTAVNTALDAVDKIRDTAGAHERTFLVGVMGRNAGFIAQHVAIAGGAELALIPETRTTIAEVAGKLAADHAQGKTSSIVIVAEGDEEGDVVGIAHRLQEKHGIASHACVLGHIQRGGSPTAADRLLASKLGVHAVDLLANGITGVMAGEISHKLVAIPLSDTTSKRKPIDPVLLDIAARLAT